MATVDAKLLHVRGLKSLNVTPLRAASPNRPEKYVVIPGNNSRAVLAAFRRRPWWGPARKEEDLSAAAVVRSSFVSRRKKGGGEKKNDRDGDGAGKKVGYRCVRGVLASAGECTKN